MCSFEFLISGTSQKLCVKDNIAYIAVYFGGGGLVTIDVNTPSAPVLLYNGSDPTGTGRDVFVLGNHAYVAWAASGMKVFNVSNPAAPVLIGENSLYASNQSSGICVWGNYAFVATGSNGGLASVNISTPANPTAISQCVTTGFGDSVACDGTHVYLADGDNGLKIFTMSGNPEYVGGITAADLGGSAVSIFIDGDAAYIGTLGAGIVIYDISARSNPQFALSDDTHCSDVTGIAVSGNYLYVADYNSGLRTYELGFGP
jgi:hypothetical protein